MKNLPNELNTGGNDVKNEILAGIIYHLIHHEWDTRQEQLNKMC